MEGGESARGGLEPQAQLNAEHPAVTEDNPAGNRPLRAVHKNERADDLDDQQGDQEIGDAHARAGHEVPAVLELARLREFLIAAEGGVLEEAEGIADDSAGTEADHRPEDFCEVHGVRDFIRGLRGALRLRAARE